MKQHFKETDNKAFIDNDGSSLLSQEARANGIVLEGLPNGIINDLRIASADGTLVENPEGGSIQDKARKPEKCKKHAESHRWRNACGKKECTHSSHAEAEEERRKTSAGKHHCQETT